MSDRSIKPTPLPISRRIALASAVTLSTGQAIAASANPPTTVQIPSVTSTDQRSGVTAGYVAQMNVVPLVPSPQLETLKAFWTNGAQLYRATAQYVVSDEKINEFCSKTNSWASDTYQWIAAHVSVYAAERFIFRPSTITLTYTPVGNHAAGASANYSNCYTGLSTFLVNLDQVMRDPSAYPNGIPPR